MEKLDSVIVTLVLKMKEIVMLMMSVKMVLLVDQTIVQLHLILTLKLIVVINQLLVMKIFVHLEFFVGRMKAIVILMMNVKMILHVGQTIAHLLLDLTLNLIVVFKDVSLMNYFNFHIYYRKLLILFIKLSVPISHGLSQKLFKSVVNRVIDC